MTDMYECIQFSSSKKYKKLNCSQLLSTSVLRQIRTVLNLISIITIKTFSYITYITAFLIEILLDSYILNENNVMGWGGKRIVNKCCIADIFPILTIVFDSYNGQTAMSFDT